MVVKSLDEADSAISRCIYLAPTGPARPGRPAQAPELLEAAARK